MERLINILFFIALFAAIGVELAHSQSINVNVVRVNPTAVPATCITGDLRIDSGDNNYLKICRSNSWVTVVDSAIFTNPMTTNGDLITRTAGVTARLAIGSANTVLKSDGSGASWGQIVNANIDNAAAIADSKLATISTASKVSNSATTATSANTASAIVARDTNGDFTAGIVTAALSGNASTATALAANPSDCGADTYATTIAASGNLTCSTVTNAGLAGSIAASKLSALTASRVVVTDGSGFISASSVTSTTLAFLDIGSSLTTLLAAKAPTASPTFTGTVTTPLTTAGPVLTSAGGVLSSEATLALSRGGSAKNMTVANGGVVWTDTDSMEVTAAGSSTQVLTSAGAAAPTWSFPSIATGVSGSYRFEWARLNCDASGSIIAQPGSAVSSVGNISAGTCIVTWTASTWSANPYCVASMNNQIRIGSALTQSTTRVDISAINDDGTNSTAFDMVIFCIGTK